MNKDIVFINNLNELRNLGLIDVYIIENFSIYTVDKLNKIIFEKEKNGKYLLKVSLETISQESAFNMLKIHNKTFYSERNIKEITNNALFCIRNAIQEEILSTKNEKNNMRYKSRFISKDKMELSLKIKKLKSILDDIKLENIIISEIDEKDCLIPINFPFPKDKSLIEKMTHVYYSYFDKTGVGVKKLDISNVSVDYNKNDYLYLSIETHDPATGYIKYFSYVYDKEKNQFILKYNKADDNSLFYNIASFHKEGLAERTSDYLKLIRSIVLENCKSL